MSASRARTSLGETAAGGCGLAVFAGVLLIFLGVGLFMAVMIGQEFLRTGATYGWRETACEILAGEVVEGSGGQYAFKVDYRYEYAGETHRSEQFTTGSKSWTDYREAQRVALAYAPGTAATCYVNPDDPQQAVLRRGSLWLGLLVLFPLIFVAIGVGGLGFLVRAAMRERRARQLRGIRGAGAAEVLPSMTERPQWSGGAMIARLVLTGFLLAGLVGVYFLGIRPLWRIVDARNWTATSCRVISSAVQSHRGDDSTTYSVNILYAYEVEGREYRANRYSFGIGSSSGRAAKDRVVAEHPPGRERVCYVNPRDPTDAVLERGWTWQVMLGLIPLVFVAVGGGGLRSLGRKRRQQRAGTAPGDRLRQPAGVTVPSASGWSAEGAAGDGGTRELQSEHSPLAKILMMLLVAVFWNGIVSVFVWQAVEAWQRGRADWFLMVFLIPFVLIGAGMVGFVFYLVLAAFNPRPTLRLAPGVLRLGETAQVEWVLRGRTHVVQRWRLFLEGREEAQSRERDRRGKTRTRTDRQVFATVEITQTTDRGMMRGGQAVFRVPPGTMHSFAARHNKIVWILRAHGEIARWPDISEEFPVTVLPRAVASGAPAMSLPV